MKVEAISTKAVKTKRGMSETFAIKCDDGLWYSCGFDKPPFAKGDEVDFEFDSTPYGPKVRMETIKISGSAMPMTPPPAPYRPKAGFAGKPIGSYTPRPEKVFPVPLTHGDRSIIRQNALTNARELLSSFAEYEGKVDLKKAAQDVIEIARVFESYSAGDIERMGVDVEKK